VTRTKLGDIAPSLAAMLMLLAPALWNGRDPILKERLYGEYDRSKFLEECRHFIGLGPAPERTYTPHILAPSLSSVSNTKGDDPFANGSKTRGWCSRRC